MNICYVSIIFKSKDISILDQISTKGMLLLLFLEKFEAPLAHFILIEIASLLQVLPKCTQNAKDVFFFI